MGAGTGTKAAETSVKAIGEQVYKNSVKTVFGKSANAVLSGAAITKPMMKRAVTNVAIESLNTSVVSSFGYLLQSNATWI